MPKTATASPEKRIVLLHTTGWLADLYQILGTHHDRYPATLRYQGPQGQNSLAHHLRTTVRSIVYQESTPEATGVLNEFSPAQT